MLVALGLVMVVAAVVTLGAFGLASIRVGMIAALASGALVIFGLALFLLVGAGGGGDDDEALPSKPGASNSSKPSSTSWTSAPIRAQPPRGIWGPEVTMEARASDRFASDVATIDELPASTVFRVTASGFQPNDSGVVEQCGAVGCTNHFPVIFDANGSARFQYLVRESDPVFGPTSTCRANPAPCVVRLRTETDTAVLTTIFGTRAPSPRRVVVGPKSRGLLDGDTLSIDVQGYTKGERVFAMLCVAPETAGGARCGAPGPVAPFTIGRDGTGHATLVVREGPVGSDGARCGRATVCGVVVQSASSVAPAPVVPITFAAGVAAQYETGRLVIGIGLAGALLAIASLLTRRTDWRKPTEADTPELDGAVLIDM